MIGENGYIQKPVPLFEFRVSTLFDDPWETVVGAVYVVKTPHVLKLELRRHDSEPELLYMGVGQPTDMDYIELGRIASENMCARVKRFIESEVL